MTLETQSHTIANQLTYDFYFLYYLILFATAKLENKLYLCNRKKEKCSF